MPSFWLQSRPETSVALWHRCSIPVYGSGSGKDDKKRVVSEDLEGGQLVVLAADSTLPARRTLPLTLRHRGILALKWQFFSLILSFHVLFASMTSFFLTNIRENSWVDGFVLLNVLSFLNIVRLCSDPTFHSNLYPDPNFHFDAAPDPHQSDANLR